MKKYVLFLVPLLFSSCMTIIKAKPPWPKLSDTVFIWYMPQKVYPFDEAVANIKNLQNSMFFEGLNPAHIKIDKYAIRAQLKWSESNYETFANQTYTYSYWGFLNFFPSSVTYQTYKETVQKEKTIIIPFKEISDIFANNKNGVYLVQKNGVVNYIKLNNSYDAQKLMDSIYILSFNAFNRKMQAKAGLFHFNLNEKQKKELKIENGVYVIVEYNSPAYHAGLRNLDIIYELNGKSIKNKIDFTTFIDDINPSQKFEVKFIRWKNKGDRYILQKFKTKIKKISR